MTVWSNEGVLTFLEAYHAEAVLWNPRDRRHREKAALKEAWSRISELLSIPVDDLKRKKESLMTTYRSYARRKNISMMSSSDVDEVYKPPWYAFDYMDTFLGTIYKCDNTLDTAPDQSEDSRASEGDPEGMCEVKPTISGIPTETYLDDPLHYAHAPRRRRRSTNHPEIEDAKRKMNSAFNDYINTVTSSIANIEREDCEDDCELYGKLLAIKLRKIPESEREEVMLEVDQLMLRKIRHFKTLKRSPSPSF